MIFKPPLYGAYSELYAAFSPDLKAEHNGGYLMAWGRIMDMPEDLKQGLKSEKDGGNGKAHKFVGYCDGETRNFL